MFVICKNYLENLDNFFKIKVETLVFIWCRLPFTDSVT